MQKIVNYIKQFRYLFLLLIISFISHWYIFFDSKILNAGDWVYLPLSLLKQMLGYSLWSSHQNLGIVIPFGSNMPFYWLASLLANISSFFSWDIFTRLFFLIPIAFFTPLFSFLLFKKFFKSDLIAFFGACIYSFNTLFLKLQLDWITYAFIWWILPALFLGILNYLEIKKNKYLVYNVLLVFLGFVYELRIMILVLVFLSLFQIIYLIFDNEPLKIRIKNNFYIFASFLLGILGHAFWLIPLRFGNIFGEIINKASSTPFYSFYDILDAFTLHMYNWSKNLVLESFIKQPIEFRHFLIPLVAIAGILGFKKRFKEKKDVLFFIFFAISLIIFIFLGKQSFGPFGGFYEWAFYNIPLFNLYRESSKFFILIALPLAFFFSCGLFNIYKLTKHYNKRLAIFTIIFILFFSSVFNLQHFIDQKIGGMIEGNIINDDYVKLEKVLSSDSNYYRILWMPIKPRFGFYSDKQAFINGVDLIKIFKDQVSSTVFDKNWPISSKLLFPLKQDCSDQFLDNMNVKYVILPIVEKRLSKISATETQIVNEIYESYGSREYFIERLDKLPFLKRIDIGTKELIVYENENYKPYFDVSQNIIYSDGGLESLSGMINFNNHESKSVIFISGITDKNISNNELDKNQRMSIKRANEVFVKGELKNKIKEEELSAGLEFDGVFYPYVRQKPGNFIYPLVLKEEQFDKWRIRKNSEKLFEKYLFYASKRLVESIKYAHDFDKMIIETGIEQYKKEMIDAWGILDRLKQQDNKNFIKNWNIYRKTLLSHRTKIEEMYPEPKIWGNVFSELEGKVEQLKVTHDFSKLVYEVEIPQEGEYEIFLNENEEKKNLGKEYFEEGNQEISLPIKGIGKDMINGKLQYMSNSIYKLSFDYQTSSISSLSIKEKYNNNATAVTNLFPTDNKFKNLEMYFQSFPEATNLTINFLDSKGNVSDIKYKNLQIQQIIQPTLTLRKVEDKKTDVKTQTPQITFVKINPTKYRIKVEGVNEPYTLLFSESFNQGWKAYVSKQHEKTETNSFFETWTKNPINEERHLLANGYANSWYITPEDASGEENYEIIIEFWPQRLFYIGLFISGLTLIGCFVYLTFDFFRKILRKK